MKITLHSRGRPFRNGLLTFDVEAVPVTIPGYEWLATAYATPFIDENGYPTEDWNITDEVTGAAFPGVFPTIDAAVEAARGELERQRIGPCKWPIIQNRALNHVVRVAS